MESDSAELPAGAAFGAALLGVPPMEEKFQRPLGSLSKVTCGLTTVISVTFNCLEKISGISSTPTFTFFAVRNGAELNLGSSLTETSSIPTEPVMSDKLKLPSCTLRPSASDALDSMVGLNLLIGIRNGTTSKITSTATTAIPIHFSLLLMETSKGSLEGRRRAPKLNAEGIISQSGGVNGDSGRERRGRRAARYVESHDNTCDNNEQLKYSTPRTTTIFPIFVAFLLLFRLTANTGTGRSPKLNGRGIAPRCLQVGSKERLPITLRPRSS